MAPPVELSTTLHSLYALDGGNPDEIALVYAFPHITKMAESLPVSVKYAYQCPRVIKFSADTMARFCLACMAQYYGFVAGPMDLRLFEIDLTKLERAYDGLTWSKSVPTYKTDAEVVFDALAPEQRPKVTFVEHAAQIASVDKKKAVITPMDWLDGHDPLIDQEVHWDLLSKRTLALSELPSPPTDVIDSKLQADQVEDIEAVQFEIDRMLETIEKRPLPFVVKLPLGLGGQAVFQVRDEAQRESCVEILREEMPAMFQVLTPENEASCPVSLLVQEVVPGSSAGVSLFITRKGRVVFISCSEQVLDERDYWLGGSMDYERQEILREQYADIIQKIGAYVAKRGYFGPMGVDVMTDEAGNHLIVDMNIRQTGSYSLGLMKHHFWEKRGRRYGGVVCPLGIRGNRAQFERKFEREIEQGTLVIASWCRGKAGPGGLFEYSLCGLMVAAETKEELKTLMDRLYGMKVEKRRK